MKRFAWPLFAAAWLLAGCTKGGNGSTGATPVAGLTNVPGMSKYALAQPINVSNVTIVPVISKEGQQTVGPEYATLAEAKKNAWIEIIETPGDAAVDTLEVHNVGPRPILLLSGDLLLGGKQDRVVAKDTIVPPGETVKIPVYCVEPGRWTGETNAFTYSDSTVPMMVKKEAAFGNQEQVWSEVGKFNARAGAGRDGRTTVNEGLSQKEVQASIDSNLGKVREKLGKDVVGLLFLVDGQIKTLELFGSNQLFAASRDSLLKGALAQAAIAKNAAEPKVDLASCAKFMAEAMQSNRVVEMKVNGTVAALRASIDTKGKELHYDDFKSPQGGSSPATSGLVHGTYTKQ